MLNLSSFTKNFIGQNDPRVSIKPLFNAENHSTEGCGVECFLTHEKAKEGKIYNLKKNRENCAVPPGRILELDQEGGCDRR